MVKSNKRNLIITVVSSVFGVGFIIYILKEWLSNLLNPLLTGFNQNLIEKFILPILHFIESILLFKVPIYSILLFGVIGWSIYKIIFVIKSKRQLFKIIKAEYGSGNIFFDITNQLNDLVIDNKLNITLSNAIYGRDPIPGKLKIGKIKYQLNDRILEKKYKEGQAVNLP